MGQQQRDTFTRQQIAGLLQVADQEWRGMILFGACHGLRLGDAARLTWENINGERQSLVFYPQKTARGANRKAEEYPLHPDVLQYTNSLPIRSRSPREPLFAKLSKRKLSGRTGLSETFRNLMHKAGIFAEGEATERKTGKGRRVFELSFHSLRHTAISELAIVALLDERTAPASDGLRLRDQWDYKYTRGLDRQFKSSEGGLCKPGIRTST